MNLGLLTSYRSQYVIAVIIAIVVFCLTLIQAADRDLLGISPRAVAWMGIIGGTLGFAGSFFPNLRRPPTEQGNEPIPPDVQVIRRTPTTPPPIGKGVAVGREPEDTE